MIVVTPASPGANAAPTNAAATNTTSLLAQTSTSPDPPAELIDATSAIADPSEPIPTTSLAWGAGGLYYSTSRGKAGGTTVDVIDPATLQASGRELARHTQYILNSDNDLLITVSSPLGYPSLVIFDLRHDTVQTIDQAAWLSAPALAPDGIALSYFRSEQDLNNVITPTVELVVFDITHNTLMIYAPAPDSTTAPAPHMAATTRLPVTQLPTPAVPTPLQAALASIKKQGNVPSDITLLSELPIYDHVLYRARGTFYSQALRGGRQSPWAETISTGTIRSPSAPMENICLSAIRMRSIACRSLVAGRCD